MNTPWGKVQLKETIERGLHSVETSSHGGFMVSLGYAKKNLSLAAQRKGYVFQNYLAYEEDCRANIIFLEIPSSRKVLINPNLDDNHFIKAISDFDADYLLERGYQPEPEAYSRYQARMEDRRLREEKNPDLIVSAMSLDDKVCKVYTADGKSYFITTESYRKRTGLNLLSKCELVSNYNQTTYLYY